MADRRSSPSSLLGLTLVAVGALLGVVVGEVLFRRIAEPRPPVFSVGISLFARSNDMEWLPYAPGVQVKLLYVDPATGAQTVLVKMEPNVPFPEHPHPAIEDLFLIEGDAYVGDVLMRAGDYCRAPAETEHNDVRSGPSGALSLVVSR